MNQSYCIRLRDVPQCRYVVISMIPNLNNVFAGGGDENSRTKLQNVVADSTVGQQSALKSVHLFRHHFNQRIAFSPLSQHGAGPFAVFSKCFQMLVVAEGNRG